MHICLAMTHMWRPKIVKLSWLSTENLANAKLCSSNRVASQSHMSVVTLLFLGSAAPSTHLSMMSNSMQFQLQRQCCMQCPVAMLATSGKSLRGMWSAQDCATHVPYLCRTQEQVEDLLGISRLEADGPPAPLYPPGWPCCPPPHHLLLCNPFLWLHVCTACFLLHLASL